MATKLNFPRLSQWPSLPVLPCRRRRLGGCGGGGVKACASRGTNGRDNGGRLVDENMIVLRMRIRGVKMLENGHDGRDQPPSDWMEWEKQYFVHYNEDVLEGIGLLQNYLMNIRPSLALGAMQ
ncbi:hypothetical protein TIFTF001_002013 [Ficus carica]|uniref:Uncharacterized protein n=1 Tax=Ficus carica TaxID=3494 RepID=A0AA88CRD7_FICCA|nr:hypothetical protein TIFTF001_002013 [Ficus carica]